MQASTAAFGATIAGNDVVVEHKVTVRLPAFRTNLCTNPSFSYATTGWTGFGGATFAISRAQHQFGDQALLVTWPTAVTHNPFAAIQCPVNPGTVYTVSLYVFVPAGAPAVQIVADGNYSAASTVTNAWQRLGLTYTSTDSSALVGVINAAATTSGQQVYIDAVLVEEAATAGSYFDGDSLADLNLCPNPSFEQMILPEWWVPVGVDVAQDSSWSVDGAYSAALNPNSASTASYIAAGGDYAAGRMRCGLVAGNTYTISATCNVPAAISGGAAAYAGRIVVGYETGAGITYTVSPQAPVGTGGTQRLAVTVTIPANATAAFVQLYNGYGNTGGPALVQWDAVLVRRAATDAAYFGGQRMGDQFWTGPVGNSISKRYVDPYPDHTLAVESVTVERQMVTDMPDGTRLIAGYPAATATITLSGNLDPTDEDTSAADLFSPYNTASPTYHGDPLDAAVVIQQGIYSQAGAELYTTFTGGVDDCLVDSIADTVTITCLDDRNKLRPTVTLPPIAYLSSVLNYAPGLTAGWVMDTLLRKDGFESSPPPRAGCQFYASMHGSAWPDYYGQWVSVNAITINTCHDVLTDSNSVYAGSPADFAAYNVPGPWSQECVRNPDLFNIPLTLASKIDASGHLYFEGWLYCDATTPNPFPQAVVSVTSDNTIAAFAGLYLTWNWSPGDATATCGLGLIRVGGSTAADKPVAGATMNTNAWTHVSMLVQFTGSTTATVTSWIDRADAPTVNTITGLPAVGAEPNMLFGGFRIDGYADSVQVTTETTPIPYRAFYPNAYLDQSLNALIAIVDTAGKDPWQVFQELAEAEQGVAGLDELGVFRFRNRANLLAAKPVRTVQSATSLKTLQTEVGKSTLANHVTASVNALVRSPVTNVWSAADVITVPARGSYSAIVSTSDPTLTPQATDFGYGILPLTPGITYWRACQTKQGTGLVTTGIRLSSRSVAANSLAVTITNANPFPVYMVSDTGHTDVPAGTPFVFIGGQLLTSPATGVVADSLWQPSVNARGEVSLQLPDNPWRQDAGTTQDLTDDVLDDLYRPRPIISNLAIVADPRLQITDRVTIVDPDGSFMDDDVVISGLVLTDSPSDWNQALNARAVSNPGDWIMGVAGRAEMGETTYT